MVRNLPVTFFVLGAEKRVKYKDLHKLKEDDDSYISEAAIKNVQWAVVISRLHVVHVVLHFHFYRVSFIVFTTLEFLVSVFL